MPGRRGRAAAGAGGTGALLATGRGGAMHIQGVQMRISDENTANVFLPR